LWAGHCSLGAGMHRNKTDIRQKNDKFVIFRNLFLLSKKH
jgi:hypothetical protein